MDTTVSPETIGNAYVVVALAMGPISAWTIQRWVTNDSVTSLKPADWRTFSVLFGTMAAVVWPAMLFLMLCVGLGRVWGKLAGDA